MLALLVAGLVLAVVVGTLRGGRPIRLLDLPVRYGPMVVVAALAQAAAAWAPDRALGTALLGASAALVAGFVVGNVGLPGVALVLLGLLGNVAAISANAARMPVSAAALGRIGHTVTDLDGDPLHVASDAATRLRFLTDWVPIATPVQGLSAVASPGDVLVVAGLSLVVEEGTARGAGAVRRRNPTRTVRRWNPARAVRRSRRPARPG